MVGLDIFTENYHLAMSTIIFPDLQTMKIKKNSGQYSPWLVMITLFLVITRRTTRSNPDIANIYDNSLAPGM